jgi:Holliday junction resolvase RusA-like endonuclease
VIELTIQGEPIAMMRPRLGREHTYNPQKKLKERVRWELRTLWPSPPIKGNVGINLIFQVSKRNKDLDNMVKFMLDAMEGIVFKNDRQVSEIYARKEAGEPCTLIEVFEK